MRLLQELDAARDISVEDVKESFYVSYEMAAHRFTNPATRHLDMPVHFLRTSREGIIGKAYENDGLPLPNDSDGGIEGQPVPRHWSARRAWDSPETQHHQFTRHDVGDFFCTTYIETAGDRTPHAISIGTAGVHGRRFRGSANAVHEDGTRSRRPARRSPPTRSPSSRHSTATRCPPRPRAAAPTRHSPTSTPVRSRSSSRNTGEAADRPAPDG